MEIVRPEIASLIIPEIQIDEFYRIIVSLITHPITI